MHQTKLRTLEPYAFFGQLETIKPAQKTSICPRLIAKNGLPSPARST